MNKKLLTDWNIVRILRILIGVSFIGESIAERQWIFLVPGVILTYQGILNTGCSSCYTGSCETSSCEVPKNKQHEQTISKISGSNNRCTNRLFLLE